MEKRNFYILVASVMIGMSIFWLTAIAIVELDINPFEDSLNENPEDNTNNGGNNDTTSPEIIAENATVEQIIIIIKGSGVKKELNLSLSDVQSDDYNQIIDKNFNFINSIGREYTRCYSGATLWSILEAEDILNEDAKTFLFVGKDGYESPIALDLDLAENYESDIILAYSQDGSPLSGDGPIRSIVNKNVIPGEPNSQYAVSNLQYIIID